MTVTKKRRLTAAMGGGLMIAVLLSVCGLFGECGEVRDSVVRLHILANSDSDEDQELKLRVRDAVTAACAGWMDGAADAGEAFAIARECLPAVEETARQTVRDAGFDYPVKAERCRMYFTTRTYDAVTLPAGMYDALRITIGSGEGHNWWCVVFPPLCLGAAADPAQLSDVLSPGGQRLVTGGERYILRFKLVEWAENLLRLLRHGK